jgi:hypothetical protein
MMIYMGDGGHWAPHTPLLDALIGERLQARGFSGTRDERKCLFGAMTKKQAIDYARNGDPEFLKVLEPQAGSVVSWVPQQADMILQFGSHLSDLCWRGVYAHNGVKFEALMRDIQGDLDIAETYLRMGRQKKKLGAMVDHYLVDLNIVEHAVQDGDDLVSILDGHTGEVWITGPCLIHKFDPSIHEPQLLAPAM